MQNLIDKIQSGDMTDNQLLTELTQYHEKSCNEYNEAVNQIELRDKEIETHKTQCVNYENRISIIAKNALVSTDYAKTLESAVIGLKGQVKEVKALKADNKKLKAQTKRQAEANKKAIARTESLTKDMKIYRKEIDVLKSDSARLRLTGQKVIGDTSFTIFPSKISGENSNERKVVLLAHNGAGCFKVVTIDNDEIVQPRSHNFKFTNEQKQFVEDFDRVAKQSGYQFTGEVLAMVN